MESSAMKKRDKRRLILDALEQVLADRRFDEVTLDAVAEAGGVGKGTIYRYFEDKEDLFFQLVQHQLQREVDAVQAVGESTLDARQKLVAAAEVIREYVMRHHSTIRTAMSVSVPARRPGCKEIMGTHHALIHTALIAILQEAAAAGLIRPEVDLDRALCLYRGLVIESSIRMMHDGAALPLDELVTLLLEGVG
jgi:AcrR family transcriptional regulator